MRNFLTIIIGVFALSIFAQNSNYPVINSPHYFTADPSPHIWDNEDTLYMYCTYDVPGNSDEVEWHVFSTTNLVEWTDHGKALGLDDINWAVRKAWAPDCAYRNGKYYFFYPARKDFEGGGMNTGVAVGNSPVGPFKEAIGKPLMERAHDPCVFKDDDGKYYLYTQKNMALLNKDMISFAEEPRGIELIGHEIPKKYEAVWVFKRRGIYYWIIAEHFNEFTYWTGDSPYGPFTYKGILMKGQGKGNNHPGIVKFKGKWILFYHDYFDTGGKGAARRICAEEIHFNNDGTIQEVQKGGKGLAF